MRLYRSRFVSQLHPDTIPVMIKVRQRCIAITVVLAPTFVALQRDFHDHNHNNNHHTYIPSSIISGIRQHPCGFEGAGHGLWHSEVEPQRQVAVTVNVDGDGDGDEIWDSFISLEGDIPGDRLERPQSPQVSPEAAQHMKHILESRNPTPNAQN